MLERDPVHEKYEQEIQEALKAPHENAEKIRQYLLEDALQEEPEQKEEAA